MAFTRNDEKRGFSVPGMIDIIFLLLLFSLVTLPVSRSNMEADDSGDRGAEFDLPRAESALHQKADAQIKTLVFEIDHADPKDTRSLRVVYVLKPSETDSLTLAEARLIAKQDSLFADFPANFLALPDAAFEQTAACRLIKQSLNAYKDAHFLEPHPANSIEIRAVRDAEFRIIRYILDRCAVYGDTIPNIAMHVLSLREGDRGI
jgi:hypothetical protein